MGCFPCNGKMAKSACAGHPWKCVSWQRSGLRPPGPVPAGFLRICRVGGVEAAACLALRKSRAMLDDADEFSAWSAPSVSWTWC